MLALDQTKVKRLTAIHGWSAVVLGWLLYAVLLTGSVAVFDDEIGAWSSGGAVEGAALAQPLDATLRRLAAETDPAYLEEIGISHTARGEPRFFFHEHRRDDSGQIRDYGVRYIIDPETGAVIDQSEGYARDISRNERNDALADFIIDLHVQLYTPEPWGLILTGILGLAMMVAVVSGILMHRHVIRDMFVAERPGNRLVSARDRHVLAGTWGIPFAFLLAFTGSFFSFAISVGLPMVALVAFGGDQERIIGALVATEVEPDPSPATLASIDYLAYDATQIARGEPPDFILIERYGRADARVSTFHEPIGGDMVGMRLAFDGPTRAFIGEMPSFGTKPSAGSAVISVMGPLHFGDFGGIASKIVWAALGAAMCFVTLSGLRLWLRRRADSAAWNRFRHATSVFAWGLPIAMTASAYGFFTTLPAGDPVWWTPASFVIGALFAVAVGWRSPDWAESRLKHMLAIALIALPLYRLLSGGESWATALVDGRSWIISIDIALALIGALLLAWRRSVARLSSLAPAE